MAFDAPAPRLLRRRRPEDREEVFLRIALERRAARRLRGRRPLRRLELFQHRFEIHDRRGGEVTALAQAGFQQIVRQLALRRGHRADQQALPRECLGRNEVPMHPFVGGERERRLLPLVRCEAVQERGRGGGHRRRGSFGGDQGADRQRGDDGQEQAEPG